MKEQMVDSFTKHIKANKKLYFIVLLAIIARVIFYLFEKNNPLFLYPVIDENEYIKKTGKALAENGLSYPFHYYHPPLYSWFIGLIMYLKGSLFTIYLVQNTLGVLGCTLLFILLKKINIRAAFITSLIWAVYPVELFIEAKFLSEAIFTFLILILIPILLSEKKGVWKYLLAGFISSLLIITKTQFLLFVIAFPLFLYFRQREKANKLLVYFISALIIPISVSFINKGKTDHFIFVSSNGPVNLYIGNSSELDRTLNIRFHEWRNEFFPSLYDEAGIRFYESDSIQEGETFEYLLSSFLIKKTLNENSDVITPVRNILHKTFIGLHAFETPRNYDIYTLKKFNPYLNYTIWGIIFFPLILFLAPAIIFIVLKWKTIWKDDKKAILLLLLILIILPSIIFFHAFRYRLPAVPFLIFFAVLFYFDYLKNGKYQLFNLGLSIVLGTNLFSGLLIQQIPLSETYNIIGDSFYDKGNSFKAEKYYNLALKALDKKKSSKSEEKDILYQKARIKQEKGDTSGAIQELTQALKADTLSKGVILYERGLMNYNSGKYKEAIEDFTNAIESIEANNKLLAECYHLRGVSYFRTYQLKPAFDDLTISLGIDPNQAKVLTARGIVLAEAGAARMAIQDFNRSIQINNINHNPFFNRGLAYSHISEFDSALYDFEKVIQLKPDFSQAYYMKGMIHKQREETNEACTFLRKALSLGFTRAGQEIEGYCE